MENTAEREEEVDDNRWMAGMRKWFYIEQRHNDLVRRGLSETGSCRGIAGWLASPIYVCSCSLRVQCLVYNISLKVICKIWQEL